MRKIGPLGVLCLALLPAAAQAQRTDASNITNDGSAEIRALRQEVAAIRAAYEARLQALEQRLRAAEVAAAQSAAVPAAAPAAASTSPTAPPAVAPQVAANAGANAFNPAISLILSGLYASSSLDPGAYAVSGLALPAGAASSVGTRGFSLAESELGLAASIDPWWRGAASLSFHPDDTVSAEEAFVQSTALGAGLSLKAGRFFSAIGYLNSQHAHTWDFADNPLVYQALLGTQLGDDGVQLRWLAPTDHYIEVALELGRGRGFPGSDSGRHGAGMKALTLHTAGDIGDSHSWRAGLSVLRTRAEGLSLKGLDAAGDVITDSFSGQTRVWVLDAVWKWAPDGNATRRNFKLQAELLRSNSRGALQTAGNYRAAPTGWYVQGVVQFMPAWRVGLRTEQIDPGSRADNPFNSSAFKPKKNTLMLDYNASEFSRLRLQWAQERSRLGLSDSQVVLQYQMSLGAHGAHAY
jgi:hypothetical protein